MKIYFAYRTFLQPNLRYIKEFEAESLLEWFQRNWDNLLDKDDSDSEVLFGMDVHDFPIWERNGRFPEIPSSLEKLKTVIEDNLISCKKYSVTEDLIQIFSGADIQEVCSFFFTEKYKQENWKKLSIWFEETLPLDFGKKGKLLKIPTYTILPEKKGKGSVYFVSCPNYNEEENNLSTLRKVYEIKGIRLPELKDYLINHDIEIDDGENVDFKDIEDSSAYQYADFGINELQYIQYLFKQNKGNSAPETFDLASHIPFVKIVGEDYKNETIENLLKRNLSFNSSIKASKVICSEHLHEISIMSWSPGYNYWIFFDDLWVEENKTLAYSIAHFASTWGL